VSVEDEVLEPLGLGIIGALLTTDEPEQPLAGDIVA
jgi:hypothetical protein